MINAEYIWLGLSILLFIIEAVTVNLVTIWFALGALGAMLTAIAGLGTGIQILVFAVISVILLMFTRPLAVKCIKKTPTNSDGLVGKHAVVTKDVNNITASGEAKINGKFWTARSENENITIPAGSIVEVVSISGVKLIVRPVENVKESV